MPSIASYCDSYSLTLTEQSSCVSVREFINIINIDVSRFLLPSCVTKNKRSVSMVTMVTVYNKYIVSLVLILLSFIVVKSMK